MKDLKLYYLIRVFKKFHGMTSFRSHVWAGEMAQQGNVSVSKSGNLHLIYRTNMGEAED